MTKRESLRNQKSSRKSITYMSEEPSSPKEILPKSNEPGHEPAWDVGLEEVIEYDYPAQFKIIIHNDHYTAMDFVVEIFIKFFHKTRVEAEELMLKIHKHGHAIAGVYPREIAESKIRDVKKLAKKNEYPLQLSMEKE